MEELKENREVAKQQATALEAQAEALTAQHDELEEQNRIARLRDDRNLILQMSGRVTPTLDGTTMRIRVSVHAFEFIVERASHDPGTATALLELFIATANWKRHPPFESLDGAMRKLNAASLRNWMPGLKAAITNMFSGERWHEDFGHSISRYEEAEAEAVLDSKE
ncbi:MAG: hypothetical protein IID36_06815 [Planctomycetes bacterium]|nr:hypothetical protein [Planctomycetota bacterium]